MQTISRETAEWRESRGMPTFVVTVKGIPHYFNSRVHAAAFVDMEDASGTVAIDDFIQGV
jgi:hypothetical protein